MSIRTMLSTTTVAVSLVGTALLTAPAAQAAPVPAPASTGQWVSYGGNSSFGACLQSGAGWVARGVFYNYACEITEPYTLWAWRV
ncbi:hypothetical protein [Streptomyces sp. CAU 1734]|uniref:hypothetical protein n=1 Tax=Streptomyces sp. CAU 1734 TaxID=3140360 RepID=UPI003260B473